jgi:ATP-dependent protease ClpP protease subunit
MKESKCHIVTRGYGHIMSAATMILAAGNKRYISKFAFFMHHETEYAIEGKHSDIKNEVHQTEIEEQYWSQWMSEFTKKSKAFWQKTGISKNAYFNSRQLVELGVADEVF